MKLAIVGSALNGGSLQIIDALDGRVSNSFIRIYDDNAFQKSDNVNGIKIVGRVNDIKNDLEKSLIDSIIIGVCSLPARKSLFDKLSYLQNYGIKFVNIISNRSIISKSAKLGIGNVILPASFIGPNVQLGDNNYITSGTCINHDCVLGSHSYLSTGVSIAGKVNMGNSIRLDTGCSITAGAKIDDDIHILPGEVFGPQRGR